MATAKDLSGLGVPGVLAALEGHTLGAVSSAGTASTTATALGTTDFALVTTASSQTGVILSSTWPLGKPVIVAVTTSDTLKVFPPASGSINGGTATTGAVDVAQNKMGIFWRYSTNAWFGIVTG